MTAAMAAVVSPASTLVSGAAALSGESALGAEAGPLEALGTGAGVDSCGAGPLNATGCAYAYGDVMMAGAAALLTGAFWCPTE